MLKANAIKLFLLLHFYHPDNNGIVYNLEACELASVIGCNVRTVWNNLKVLEEYTYISYSKNEYGLINVILNDYENYYLPANKGGRGFLVMSKELLTKLNSTDSLVSLRIFIRELLSLDSPELKVLQVLITRTYAIYVIRFHLTASLRLLKQSLRKTPIYSMLHSKMMLSGLRSIKHISQRTRKLMYMRNM